MSIFRADSKRTFQMLHVSVINFYCLEAKIFLPINDFLICFLMKILIFHQWFSIHDHSLATSWIKKTAKQNNFTFHETNIFLKCPTLHVSNIKSFLDLKLHKKLLNKSWEPLNAAVSCMDKWLIGNVCLRYCGTSFMKNWTQ